MTKECTDWVAIGQELNRIPSKCADKWRDLHASRMKKGPFAAEEDALMRQRVAEWEREGKPKGLWVSLQKEMDRRAQSIRMHWKIALATRALDWDRKENWEEWMFTPLLEREKSKFRWTKSMVRYEYRCVSELFPFSISKLWCILSCFDRMLD